MKTLSRMMEHLYWANERIVNAVEEQGVSEGYIPQIIFHLIHSERVWLIRLQGGDSSHIGIWNQGNVSEISSLIRENERDYRSYMYGLREEKLDSVISYRNQSGVPFQTSIRDILTHVALHGHYHRGQINRALREESYEPQMVDYIIFSREGT